jgi:hypothetical protein
MFRYLWRRFPYQMPKRKKAKRKRKKAKPKKRPPDQTVRREWSTRAHFQHRVDQLGLDDDVVVEPPVRITKHAQQRIREGRDDTSGKNNRTASSLSPNYQKALQPHSHAYTCHANKRPHNTEPSDLTWSSTCRTGKISIRFVFGHIASLRPRGVARCRPYRPRVVYDASTRFQRVRWALAS